MSADLGHPKMLARPLGIGVPEEPTLIEKFVELIPLRYEFAALVWAVILMTLAYHVVEYIDHGSTSFSRSVKQGSANVQLSGQEECNSNIFTGYEAR